jgi:hypothetical protein
MDSGGLGFSILRDWRFYSSGMGFYAVVSYAIARHRRIGLRMALGAGLTTAIAACRLPALRAMRTDPAGRGTAPCLREYCRKLCDGGYEHGQSQASNSRPLLKERKGAPVRTQASALVVSIDNASVRPRVF